MNNEIFEQIRIFYRSNQTLVTAIAAALVTWLLNRFGPAIYTFLVNIVSNLGQKFGGRLAFYGIQRKYLNWVVLENQDLNLTGIIGVGEKPKLEQIFISLKVLDSEDLSTEDVNDSVNTSSSSSIVSRFFAISRSIIANLIPISTNASSTSIKQSETDLFKVKPFSRIRLFIGRDVVGVTLLLTLLISVFLLFPVYTLLLSPTTNNIILATSTFVLTFTMLFGFYLVRVLVKEGNSRQLPWLVSLSMSLIPVVGLPVAVWNRLIINSQSPWPMVIGAAIGIVSAYVVIRRAQREERTEDVDRELNADEVGHILSTFDNVAILGKPGAGKSTYVQFIALTFAQEKAGERKFRKSGIVNKRFGTRRWLLPILIPLRRVSNVIKDPETLTNNNLLFEAFYKEVLPSYVRELFSRQYLQFMLRKKRCLFLLDGLDEVSDDNEFRVVVNEIKGLVSQFPGNKFIVTSRHSGWRGGVGSAFLETEVSDLNADQVNTFINCWYTAVESNHLRIMQRSETTSEKSFRERQVNTKVTSLQSALSQVPSIRKLSQNPLLLSMICFVHYNKTLPKERLSLYGDCTRLLLEQWDIEKGLRQNDTDLTLSNKEIMMQEIAYAIHSKLIGSGKDATSREITSVIEKTLKRFKTKSVSSKQLFDKLIKRTGLIVPIETYKDLYGFSHLTFQEYYSAEYLYRNNLNILEMIETDANHSIDTLSWWREVILLNSNIQRDTNHIIHGLCQISHKNILRLPLQIAAQTYYESVELPTPEIEKELMSQIFYVYTGIRDYEEDLYSSTISKDRLIEIAIGDNFYTYCLVTAMNESEDNGTTALLANDIFEMTKSPNGAIKSAAMDAILTLWSNGHGDDLINQEHIEELLSNGTTSQKIDIGMFFGIEKRELVDNQFATKIIHQLIGILIDNFRDNAVDCPSFNRIVEYLDVDGKSDLQQLIIRQLSSIFNDPPEYKRSLYPYLDTTLRDNIECLLSMLLTLDTVEQRMTHQRQIQDMLGRGQYNQQVWAVFLTPIVVNSDIMVFEAVKKKFRSPSSKVRLAAVAQLRHLKLDEATVSKCREVLSSSLQRRSVVTVWLHLLIELFTGKGTLGSTSEEIIQVSGTLFWLSANHNDAILKDALSNEKLTVYSMRGEWKDVFADIGRHLSRDMLAYIKENQPSLYRLLPAEVRFPRSFSKTSD